MQIPSFTVRVIALYVVLSLTTGIVMQIVLTQLLRQSLIHDADKNLLEEAGTTGNFIRILKERQTPRAEIQKELIERTNLKGSDYFVEIISNDGTNLYRSPNLRTTHLTEDQTKLALKSPVTITADQSKRLRMVGKSFDNFGVYVAYPIDGIDAIISESYSDVTLLIPLSLSLLIAGGLLLFSYFIQPIRRLNKYMELIASHPNHEDLPDFASTAKGALGKLVDRVYNIVKKMQRSRNQALNFSSMASHEIRTPLAIIRNQMESALDSRLSARTLRRIVGSTYDEMLRLNKTVEDLLSLSTLQAGTFKLDLETISLSDFLARFYDEALFLTRPKNLSVVLKKGPKVFIQADAIRLRQVLFNLLENAIKHTPEGKRIRLSHSVERDHVCINFSDTGRGIPPEKLTRIFDPFYKDNSNGTKTKGSGLGLALVKWITDSHGGKVDVKSELGIGTTFAIRLPLNGSPLPT